MKKIIFVLALLVFFSCKRKEDIEVLSVKIPKSKSEKVNECYQYVSGKDTITARITIDDEKVNGDLAYKFFEKDKSSGPISGIAKGDTLIVEYSFASEGTQSVREVVWLRKNNTLTEGYGDIQDNNGKVTFRDKSALNFTGNLILQKMPCD